MLINEAQVNDAIGILEARSESRTGAAIPNELLLMALQVCVNLVSERAGLEFINPSAPDLRLTRDLIGRSRFDLLEDSWKGLPIRANLAVRRVMTSTLFGQQEDAKAIFDNLDARVKQALACFEYAPKFPAAVLA